MRTQGDDKDRELCEKLRGKRGGSAVGAMQEEFCPDSSGGIMDWDHAGDTAGPGLPVETRVLLLLARSICRGELPLQVKAWVEAARGLGISKATIAEAILRTIPVAGFPAVTHAFLAANDVIEFAAGAVR